MSYLTTDFQCKTENLIALILYSSIFYIFFTLKIYLIKYHNHFEQKLKHLYILASKIKKKDVFFFINIYYDRMFTRINFLKTMIVLSRNIQKIIGLQKIKY